MSNGIQQQKTQTGSIRKFRLCSGQAGVVHQSLTISSTPDEGDTVVDSRGANHRLVKSIGAGGEGSVFLTDTNMVCKVYDPAHLTSATRHKLELMLTRPLRYPGVCWPRSLAFNAEGEFCGYLMEQAQGKELQKAIFIRRNLSALFPNWTRLQLVTLIISILERMSYLHQGNVLLGDINPLNILVQDEISVFLIDADSYQIEGFPCPVGTPAFSAPEIAGQNLRDILRTPEHEYFAIASLCFMILMLGKAPYSHQGGADPAKNIQKGQFSYCRGENGSNGVPKGPFYNIWSHLPRYLKEQFHRVFTDGERLSTEEWLECMRRYRSDLQKGYVSDELFPTGPKALPPAKILAMGGHMEQCAQCGQSYAEYPNTKTGIALCPACRNSTVSQPCPRCGSSVDVPMYQHCLNQKRGKQPKLCDACRAPKKPQPRPCWTFVPRSHLQSPRIKSASFYPQPVFRFRKGPIQRALDYLVRNRLYNP